MQKLGTKVGSKIFIKGYQKTGKKVAGQVYGNDNVNVTLSVISYQQVLKEDLEKLKAANLIELLKDNKYTAFESRKKDAKQIPITLPDFQTALQSLIDSKERALSKLSDGSEEDPRYEYVEAGIKKSISSSDMYVHGVIISEEYNFKAERPPRSKSLVATAAKRILEKKLELQANLIRQYKVSNASGSISLI